jgi:hypothetical protein
MARGPSPAVWDDETAGIYACANGVHLEPDDGATFSVTGFNEFAEVLLRLAPLQTAALRLRLDMTLSTYCPGETRLIFEYRAGRPGHPGGRGALVQQPSGEWGLARFA